MAQAQAQAKLDVGEKYLSISILGQIKLAAFPNKNRKSEKDPKFIGNGVAVWINSKKATEEKVEDI